MYILFSYVYTIQFIEQIANIYLFYINTTNKSQKNKSLYKIKTI